MGVFFPLVADSRMLVSVKRTWKSVTEEFRRRNVTPPSPKTPTATEPLPIFDVFFSLPTELHVMICRIFLEDDKDTQAKRRRASLVKTSYISSCSLPTSPRDIARKKLLKEIVRRVSQEAFYTAEFRHSRDEFDNEKTPT
jgi:hypothetical protein